MASIFLLFYFKYFKIAKDILKKKQYLKTNIYCTLHYEATKEQSNLNVTKKKC